MIRIKIMLAAFDIIMQTVHALLLIVLYFIRFVLVVRYYITVFITQNT